MLHIDAEWSKPLNLVDDPEEKYVGETGNLRSRLTQHLKNNVRMIRGIQNAPNGRRIFLFGEVRLKRGQKVRKVCSVLQRALIERAFAEGHELLNDKGAKTPIHSIRSTGNRYSEQVAGRLIFCPK